MSWVFKEKKPGDAKARNPVSDEFFTDPELLTDASSLVREAIQNSLDAQIDKEQPVQIRFKVGEKVLGDEDYFVGLEKHTIRTLGSSQGKVSKACRYLVYEDFNTTGLWGDSNLDFIETAANKEEHSYTFFVHYEGEGSKSDGKKGKWGIGKIVFPMLSGLKTFFAYSVRSPEKAPCGRENILIGQSIQRFHEIDGVPYYPDGWYVADSVGVPIPHHGEVASAFAQDWGLKRELNETGLSILVPFIRPDLGIAQFRDAVIRQYFLAILAGELECSFEDEAGSIITLDSENITQVIEMIQNLTEGSPRDMTTYQVKTAISGFSKATAEVDAIEIELPVDMVAPSALAVPDESISAAIESLEENGIALFKIYVKVPIPIGESLSRDYFEALLIQADGENSIIYSREGILVPGTRAVKVRDFIVLVMVDEGALANLLGFAEGPAHEDWRDDTKKFRASFGVAGAKKARASWTLKAVRNFPKRIVELISRTEAQQLDREFFSDWFGPSGEDDGTTPDPVTREIPLPKPAPNFSVKDGVLRVSSGSRSYALSSKVQIDLAYSVSRGNAFAKYSEIDFSLSDDRGIKIQHQTSQATVKSQGVTISSAKKNSLKFEINDPKQWSIEIPGFELYRDIEVRSGGVS